MRQSLDTNFPIAQISRPEVLQKQISKKAAALREERTGKEQELWQCREHLPGNARTALSREDPSAALQQIPYVTVCSGGSDQHMMESTCQESCSMEVCSPWR